MKISKLLLICIVFIGILFYLFTPYLFTPFQWKGTLYITEVSVLSDNENITIQDIEQIQVIQSLIKEMDIVPIIRGTEHVNKETNDYPFIRLLFMESDRNYIFHGGGNRSYYLEYERGGSNFSHIVANGEEIHERLLGILDAE